MNKIENGRTVTRDGWEEGGRETEKDGREEKGREERVKGWGTERLCVHVYQSDEVIHIIQHSTPLHSTPLH